jgi:hypothetical protein
LWLTVTSFTSALLHRKKRKNCLGTITVQTPKRTNFQKIVSAGGNYFKKQKTELLVEVIFRIE